MIENDLSNDIVIDELLRIYIELNHEINIIRQIFIET